VSPRAAPPRSTLALVWRLTRARPGLMALNFTLWGAIHALPLFAGVLFKGVFDALAAGADALWSPWTFLALALAVDLTRIGVLAGGIFAWATYWAELVLRMRRNLLAHVLTAPGARHLPESPSEAISRFRDDVEDIAQYVENWVDFWGLAIYGIGALWLMLRIDPLLTAWIALPLLLTLLLTQWLRPLIRRVRRRLRDATGRVTDFIGEMFGAIASVQASGREAAVVAAFHRLGAARRRAAVHDALLGELFKNVNDNMVHVATGIILLVGAQAMQRGEFSVGDFALFLTFLPRLTGTVSFIGEMLLQHRRTGVAFERLDGLLQGASAERVVADVPMHLSGPIPPFLEPQPARIPLQTLSVEGLRVLHRDGTVALEGVGFTLTRGSFTVITGPVGAGKSSLVRALLGLIPRADGVIRWNGVVVEDPSRFFVPPQSAYTSQTPRLFSTSLFANIVQGRADADRSLPAALRLAVLDHDIGRLDRGLETEVGTRGVKLSGGQVQRSAAARMFMRDAELLVFDDLSSALDVDTEGELWERLARERGSVTCLVVSHRKPALARADQVLLLEAGRLVACGTPEEVRTHHPHALA
jgi:ATP-binding cassette, subfamily B, bacterial